MEKDTKLALLLALLVGIIYLFPHVIYLTQPGTYNPLYISQNRGFMDEAIYSAGVQEVLEGNFIPTDLATIEHKHSLMIYGPLPFIIMAIITLITKNIISTIIITDFIFAAITFYLFYLLTKKVTSSHSIALISSTLLLFFYRIFIPPPTIALSSLKDYLLSIFINSSQGNANLWLSRFMHPQITLPLLLLTILVAWKAYETKQQRYFIATSLLIAANMYSYFYNWTYIIVFIGTFFTTYVFFQHDTLKNKLLPLTLTAILTLILAIPHIKNTLALKSLDITARSGVEYGRNIETISYLFLLLIVAVLIISYKKQKSPAHHNPHQKIGSNPKSTIFQKKLIPEFLQTTPLSSILLLSLLLSAFIVLNIQLIIGYTIQNDHYYSRILVPIVILALAWIISSISLLKTLLEKKYVAAIFLTLLFLSACIVQQNEIKGQHANYAFTPEEQELITTLQSLAPNNVILTSSITWNLWIPAYTHSDIYFPYSASTIASKEEMENRFITTFQLLKYTPNEVNQLLTANSSYTRIATSRNPTDLQTYMRSYIYLDEIYPVENVGAIKTRTYNDKPVQTLIKKYSETDSQKNYSRLPSYQLNYILLTAQEKARTEEIQYSLQQRGYHPIIIFENKEYQLMKIE